MLSSMVWRVHKLILVEIGPLIRVSDVKKTKNCRYTVHHAHRLWRLKKQYNFKKEDVQIWFTKGTENILIQVNFKSQLGVMFYVH